MRGSCPFLALLSQFWWPFSLPSLFPPILPPKGDFHAFRPKESLGAVRLPQWGPQVPRKEVSGPRRVIRASQHLGWFWLGKLGAEQGTGRASHPQGMSGREQLTQAPILFTWPTGARV